MEPICKGWLTKSPPEQKSHGGWKIFGAKWKRRFFVLYAPPGVPGISGARAAMLEYYTSKKLSTKIGFINLEDCGEVMSDLDSDTYKNVFGLHTKHKGRSRTYYLVAETEEEMNNWVLHLCNVLGLLENDENKFQFSADRALKTSAQTLPRPVPNLKTHPKVINQELFSNNSPPSSALSPFSSRLNLSESNLLDNRLFPPNKEEKLKNSGSVPELESIHLPGPTKQREKMELPPIPPEKSRKSLEDLVSEGSKQEPKGSILVSNLVAEECLGMPPPKPPKEKKKKFIHYKSCRRKL